LDVREETREGERVKDKKGTESRAGREGAMTMTRRVETIVY
jgi:hypothetical protein